MRGVGEFEAPAVGVGCLDGEGGVLLDSRMPFSLPMPVVSV